MTVDWKTLRPELEAQFLKLSDDRALVGTAAGMFEDWLRDPICEPLREPLLAHVDAGQFPLLLDSFYQFIPFGTGGRRGRVGYGPNRINPVTVALSVQGHCNYLRTTRPSGGLVVVAYDTRCFSDLAGTYGFLGPNHPLLGLTSRLLAIRACEIYAANGFEVVTPLVGAAPAYFSTPELSFSIRHLGALGGMNVSASHNHPDDNGFKFFNEHGAQDVPPTDQRMTEFMQNIKEARVLGFEEAAGRGLIRPMPPSVHQSYLSLNLALASGSVPPRGKVVYSPLCGTGDSTVGDVLRNAGVDVELFGPQANFDGTFASIPFRLPNPEVPEAARPALIHAKQTGADLVLCTDPDADRLGAYAKASDGSWRYLNGNEIGAILAYYLVADRVRGPQRTGLLVKTLVTTQMLESIAAKAGCAIVGDLLVGFKYIANVLLSLEREGRYGKVTASPADLVLAAEESHGFLLTPHIRDKDAAGAALILCELLSKLRAEGGNLPEYLDRLTAECGDCRSVARSIVMRGIRGAGLLTTMMGSLREQPPAAFAGLPVVEYLDLLSEKHGPLLSETDRQARNFLVFRLSCAQIVVRPSGTEPKAKVYVDLRGDRMPDAGARSDASAFARQLGAAVLEDCIGRIGYKLSSSAHLLPDYVDLDLKADFDRAFRGELEEAAGKLAGAGDGARLDWLRKRLGSYTAGADPIDATATAVDNLCDEIRRQCADPAVQAGLEALQKTLAAARQPVEWIS
ncbi:MAG: phospho-sugar mutase [Bryobacteraceae bacterium]